MSRSPQSPEFPEEDFSQRLGRQYEGDHPEEGLEDLKRDVHEMFSPPMSDRIIESIRRSRLGRIFGAPVSDDPGGDADSPKT